MLWASASTSGAGTGAPAPCGFAGPRVGGAAARRPADRRRSRAWAAPRELTPSRRPARESGCERLRRSRRGLDFAWLRRSARRGAGALSFAARGGAAASGASVAALAAAGLPRRRGLCRRRLGFEQRARRFACRPPFGAARRRTCGRGLYRLGCRGRPLLARTGLGHDKRFLSLPGVRPGPVLVIIGHYRLATPSRLSE